MTSQVFLNLSSHSIYPALTLSPAVSRFTMTGPTNQTGPHLPFPRAASRSSGLFQFRSNRVGASPGTAQHGDVGGTSEVMFCFCGTSEVDESCPAVFLGERKWQKM